MFNTGNDTVDMLGTINFSGNVIPASWYKTITKENGRAHHLAIVILADIVYWYRPQEVRDENTGQLIGYRKKFHSDLLQRSYDAIADLVGEEKRTVKRAIKLLCDIGVIKLEFRTVYVNGKRNSNVMYIDLIADKLFEITYSTDVPMTKNCNRVLQKNVIAYDKKLPHPMTKNCNTNTKNTLQENTISSSSSSCEEIKEEEEKIKNQIDYLALGKKYGHVVDMLVSEILNLSPENQTKVTYKMADSICRTYKNNKGNVVVPVKYISTCLKSAIDGGKPPDEIKPKNKNKFNQCMTRDDYDFASLEKILTN